MNTAGLSGSLMRFAHRELQVVALVFMGAAMLSGGGALFLGLLHG